MSMTPSNIQIMLKTATLHVLLVCLSPLLTAQTIQQSPEVAALEKATSLDDVRKAVGIDSNPMWQHGVIFTGEAVRLGIDQTFKSMCIPDGRYMWEFQSALATAAGFDGKDGWKVDWTGMPCADSLEGIRVEQLFTAAYTGYWLDHRSLVTVKSLSATDKVLRFELRIGETHGVIVVDALTLLPQSYSWQGGSSDNELKLSKYSTVEGARFPMLVEGTIDRSSVQFRTQQVTAAVPASAQLCAVRLERPDDVVFTDAGPSTLKLKKTWTGHLLVAVQVDGAEERYFMLDSGAGSHCIDTKYAQELELESIGKTPVNGVGGAVQSDIVRLKTLRVGPFTQKNPVLISLDFQAIGKILKTDIAGVVGYDFFARALVGIDIVEATVEIAKPGAWDRREAGWRELTIRKNHPCVECRFEGDRKGLFRIDTGADGTVSFHADYVAQQNLLEGRETKVGGSGGVGGIITVQDGRLDWFEVGRHRFEKPMVRFVTGGNGVLSEKSLVGNVGVEFLKPFRLLFDYPGGRLGFEARKL